MCYHWKLTNFTTGKKHRAQNCLTVSNIKLDDVFSGIFGKAASVITNCPLESNDPFDMTPYLTKGIKAPEEKIQTAVDGEMCTEQAEKLRIIRSHMDASGLCTLHLQSLILFVAEKYLSQLNIVVTVPGVQTFPRLVSSRKLAWICSCFPPRSFFALGPGLRRRRTRAPGRKRLPGSAALRPTSSPYSSSASYVPPGETVPRSPPPLPRF